MHVKTSSETDFEISKPKSLDGILHGFQLDALYMEHGGSARSGLLF